MKLPTQVKHALIEAMIAQYTEDYPSCKISQEPLRFQIAVGKILEDTEVFGITESDIKETVTSNPDSLLLTDDSEAVQFIPPFTRKCDSYNKLLDYMQESTKANRKFTVEYDPSIRESLIYNFFSGKIVLMVPEEMTGLSQLRFALMAGGSKLRAIIDDTGGWIYVFPKHIMEAMECGKMPARDTNVNMVIASYLADVFPDE
ncbi:hypothetical protein [Methanolobus bombayensis]|uniref:hypothetical protein n=1 Tax=Methanolobus bombayensis TaxID=38023 RepID=UPI001AE97F3C|nr:hypothetical protein [Methanolobus bombayensis]MBP1908490.1 hypothetical protein [Methanolobus bombayensis]